MSATLDEKQCNMKMAKRGDTKGLEGSFDEGMKVEEIHTHEESQLAAMGHVDVFFMRLANTE